MTAETKVVYLEDVFSQIEHKQDHCRPYGQQTDGTSFGWMVAVHGGECTRFASPTVEACMSL